MKLEIEKKPKIKLRVLLRLGKYLYRYKLLLFAAAVLTVTSNVFALLGPELSGRAINAIEPGVGAVDFESVFYYASLMLVFYIASAVLSYILSVIMIKLGRNVAFEMRRDVFDKLVSLPVSFFDHRQTGDIISIISYDIDTINSTLSADLMQICTSIITVSGSLIMMLIIAPRLVWIFAVTIPVSLLFAKYITRVVRPLFRRRSAKLGELNGLVEELTAGHRTIKAYHRENRMIERFEKKNIEAVDTYYTADYYGSIMGPCVNFINNTSLALVSVFGAILYLGGSIALGDISSFVLYSRKFSGPINEMANILGELQSTVAAAERVFRLLDEAPEPQDSEGAVTLTNVRGNVGMKNVVFGYEADKTIIHDLSFAAKSGSVIAIVGPTGAGKTTIINLLMRFYDVQSGSVTVDGTEIRDITRKSLRLAYTMVLQDTWLFYGTIYENIAYGKENVTREEVEAAAKAAKIHSYIMRLPNGYDSLLSDNGVNISKGQKQLLTIARAMLLDSKMLILDEATSNVDTQTELKIQSAMLDLMREKTCFVIAHRLSTIKNADLILVISNGDIVEQGTHKELMRRGGFYSQLYYSQFDE